MDLELAVMTFEDKNKAREVLGMLRHLQKTSNFRMVNSAILKMSETGKATIHETQDVDAPHGAIFGAILGGVLGAIGVLAGPVGVFAGSALGTLAGTAIGVAAGSVAGATVGGAAGYVVDLGFPDEYLMSLEEGLKPGTSALVVMVGQEHFGLFEEATAGMDYQLYRFPVKEELAEKLKAATPVTPPVEPPDVVTIENAP